MYVRVRPFGRQVLPQEPKCLAHDVARRSAVGKEIKGVRAFGMVHEGNREVLNQSLTDKTVDGGIHRGKLVTPAPREEQRHISSKIRDGATAAWVCESEPLRRIGHVGRAVQIK